MNDQFKTSARWMGITALVALIEHNSDPESYVDNTFFIPACALMLNRMLSKSEAAA